MEEFSWPSREQWAKCRRTFNGYEYPNAPDGLHHYATPDEASELQTALRERWKDMGRQMKQAPECAADCEQHDRCRYTFRYRRASVNRGLKKIRAGRLPILLNDNYGAKDILQPYLDRYQAAQGALIEAARTEVQNRPIDDAAWQAELEWREKISKGCVSLVDRACTATL